MNTHKIKNSPSKDLLVQAKNLRKNGKTYKEIGKIMLWSETKTAYWVNNKRRNNQLTCNLKWLHNNPNKMYSYILSAVLKKCLKNKWVTKKEMIEVINGY